MLRVAILVGLVAGLACAQTDMCERRGGRWYDSVLDPRLSGSCVMPAVDVGNPCTEAAHCQAGYCACAEATTEGALMTGVCPEFAAKKSDGWLCTVSNGVAHPQGLQVE
jgi:hypothetical protein